MASVHRDFGRTVLALGGLVALLLLASPGALLPSEIAESVELPPGLFERIPAPIPFVAPELPPALDPPPASPPPAASAPASAPPPTAPVQAAPSVEPSGPAPASPGSAAPPSPTPGPAPRPSPAPTRPSAPAPVPEEDAPLVDVGLVEMDAEVDILGIDPFSALFGRS